VGSNYRHLACKAEKGQEYAQLTASAHAPELRKPCLEMPSGAWESLHGGSRKWFPEQSADYSHVERVTAWRQGYRSRTCRMSGTPLRAPLDRWTRRRRPTGLGTCPRPRPGGERVLGSRHPDSLRTREQLNCLTSRADGRPTQGRCRTVHVLSRKRPRRKSRAAAQRTRDGSAP